MRTGVGELVEGTMLGKYRVVRAIGAGAMGAVYVGMHKDTGDRVAIKVLDRRLASMRQARERFRLEAQIAKRVRHPNIVDVFDAGDAGRNTYLVMELLTGEDLAQRLESAGPLPAEEVADILIPICGAIAAAHQADVTHRDLKPLNIFLAAGNPVRPKVLDFGISIAKGIELPAPANPRGSRSTVDAGLVGSPCYLAPEQVANSAAAGPASDQYALGVIAYECLTGERPFDGNNLEGVLQAIAAGEPRPPRALQPDVPPGLEAVVLRALRRDPVTRFASVNDLGRALLPFASETLRAAWETTFGQATPGADPAPSGDPAPGAAPEAGAGAKVAVTLDSLIAAAAAAAATVPSAAMTAGARLEPTNPRLGVGAPRVRTLFLARDRGRGGHAEPLRANPAAPGSRAGGGVGAFARAAPVDRAAGGPLRQSRRGDPDRRLLEDARRPPGRARRPPADHQVGRDRGRGRNRDRGGRGARDPGKRARAGARDGRLDGDARGNTRAGARDECRPAPPPPPAVVPPKPAPVAAAVAPPPAAPPVPAAPPEAAPPREAPPRETAPVPTTPAPSALGARQEVRADERRADERRADDRIDGRVDEADRSASKGERRSSRGSGAESKRRVPLLD